MREDREATKRLNDNEYMPSIKPKSKNNIVCRKDYSTVIKQPYNNKPVVRTRNNNFVRIKNNNFVRIKNNNFVRTGNNQVVRTRNKNFVNQHNHHKNNLNQYNKGVQHKKVFQHKKTTKSHKQKYSHVNDIITKPYKPPKKKEKNRFYIPQKKILVYKNSNRQLYFLSNEKPYYKNELYIGSQYSIKLMWKALKKEGFIKSKKLPKHLVYYLFTVCKSNHWKIRRV